MDTMKIKQKVGEKLDTLIEQGINSNNLDAIDKLVDVMKDVHEIEKMEEGGKYMNKYSGRDNNEYGNYPRYREGYNESRYSEGNYSRRGVKGTGRGRYRGEEMIDEMYGAYNEYEEGRQQYSQGNYGAENQKIQSLEYMMECVVELVKHLEEKASSQEEKKIVHKAIKEMQEMMM